MQDLNDMAYFAEVVERGGFAAAGRALGLPKSRLSRRVAELEARLGVRLLQRTTRKLSLTEVGEVYHRHCMAMRDQADAAADAVAQAQTEPRGTIRIACPVTLAQTTLGEVMPLFLARYPLVKVDMRVSNRVVDLVEEGYDVAIRIATLPSSTLISKRLTSTRMVLCASPKYIKKHGAPAHPSELSGHAVLAYTYWSTKDEWHFDGPAGHVSVRTNPCIHTNSGDTCRVAALAHQGIIMQPSFLVGDDLAAGTLVELIPQFHAMELGVYAVYPTRKHVSPKVRALIDFLSRHFAKKRATW